MASYIARRLLQLLLVLWGGATLLFFLFFMINGKPAERVASHGGTRAPTEQQIKNTNEKYGFDKPIPVQYVRYLRDVAKGDLKISIYTQDSVTAIIKNRAPTSLRLAFWAVLLEAVVGIGGGMISARRRNSIADYATTTSAVLLSAIPVFVLGYLLKQVFGVIAFQHHWPKWATFPTRDLGDDKWFLWVIPSSGTWKSLVLPAIVLASVSTALLARITRTSMLETMRMDHVRTARSKGLTERRVMRRHVLRNGLVPVITVLGPDFGTMVGVAVLTETVFNINGLGSTIVTAAQGRDMFLAIGLVMFVTLIYGLCSLVVDVAYAYLNPRIRLGDL
jgi:ABC-type dipeptide/oligopeptide/nickel transport system permease component